MKFKEYFIANSEGKSNCVIRTFCKIFNKSYDEVYKDLKIDGNTHVVLCSDKKDFYHMVPIINNTVYDKNDSSLNLYVLSLYK